jgi:hypothetical protein
VKVWWQQRYPQDEAKAQSIADAMDATIWPGAIELMGIEPLSDENQFRNGGDARLDMYLVGDVELLGEYIPHARDALGYSCEKTSGHILINRVGPHIINTAAHELFHALQFARDEDSGPHCSSVHWMQEATATWGDATLYPDANVEHNREYYFDYPEQPLDEPLDTIGKYGRYIFFYYLSEKFGDDIVRQIAINAQTMLTIQAIDAAVPGGLVSVWPEFALRMWNRAPFDDLYQADEIPQQAAPRDLISRYIHDDLFIPMMLGDQHQVAYEDGGGSGQDHFDGPSMEYWWFKVEDEDIRSVTIQNPMYDLPAEELVVQVLTNRPGVGWERHELSYHEEETYCLDNPEEAITEFVLVISHVGPGSSTYYTRPIAIARDTCGWTGEATVEYFRNSTCLDAKMTGHATDLLFTPMSDSSEDEVFKLNSGSITFEFEPSSCNTSQGLCTRTADPMTIDLGEANGELRFSGDGAVTFELSGMLPGAGMTVMEDCASPPDRVYEEPINFPWLCGGGQTTADVSVLQGEESYSSPQDPPPIPTCPATSGQGSGGVHPADLIAVSVDWTYNLER